MNTKVTVMKIGIRDFDTIPKNVKNNLEELKIWWKNGNYLKDNRIEIGKNPEKGRTKKTCCHLDSNKDHRLLLVSAHTNSKLSQEEYKTRHDWVGKVIHWELCKRLKFDHPDKFYIRKPEFVLENAMHKILWDFAIQMDYQMEHQMDH